LAFSDFGLFRKTLDIFDFFDFFFLENKLFSIFLN